MQHSWIQREILLPPCPTNRHLRATANRSSPDLRLFAAFWTEFSFVQQEAELCQPRLIRGISLLPKSCHAVAFKELSLSSRPSKH